MATIRPQANQEAYRRLCESQPVLTDVLPARDAVPGFSRDIKPVDGNSSFPGFHAVPNITSNSGNILQKFLSLCFRG